MLVLRYATPQATFLESNRVLGLVIGRLCAFLSLLLLVMRSFVEVNPPAFETAIASNGKNNNRKLSLALFAEILRKFSFCFVRNDVLKCPLF